MPACKHFFHGYCRSKDVLTTIGQKFTEATLVSPWTVKSQGVISAVGATPGNWIGKEHLCLSRVMPSGRTMNVVFIEDWKTTSNNIWGNPSVGAFMYDGANFATGSFTNGFSGAEFNGWFPFSYHGSQVADDDSFPQFAWYWMSIYEEGATIALFGNTGATGSATPIYRTLFIGDAFPSREGFRRSEILYSSTDNRAMLWDSLMEDFLYPGSSFNWSMTANNKCCIDVVGVNTANSNPDSYSQNKYVASRPKLGQAATRRYYSYAEHGDGTYLLTHTIGNGQMLFCQPSQNANLLWRGDIITIDESGSDYVFQTNGADPAAGNAYHINVLLKRMESASNLSAIATAQNVELSWKNPNLFYGVKIVRKENSAPVAHTDGDAVFNDNTDGTLVPGNISVANDSGVSGGKTYHYVAFAYDSNEVYSVPVASAKTSVVTV